MNNYRWCSSVLVISAVIAAWASWTSSSSRDLGTLHFFGGIPQYILQSLDLLHFAAGISDRLTVYNFAPGHCFALHRHSEGWAVFQYNEHLLNQPSAVSGRYVATMTDHLTAKLWQLLPVWSSITHLLGGGIFLISWWEGQLLEVLKTHSFSWRASRILWTCDRLVMMARHLSSWTWSLWHTSHTLNDFSQFRVVCKDQSLVTMQYMEKVIDVKAEKNWPITAFCGTPHLADLMMQCGSLISSPQRLQLQFGLCYSSSLIPYLLGLASRMYWAILSKFLAQSRRMVSSVDFLVLRHYFDIRKCTRYDQSASHWVRQRSILICFPKLC